MMFDFAPIETTIRLRRPDLDSDVKLGDYLGIDRRNLPRWRQRGITAYRVDELCIRHLGMWPGDLYPDWCSARRVVREHLAARGVAA